MARTLFTITGLLFLSVLLTDTNEAAPSTGTIQVAFILSEFEDQAYQDDHDQDYFDDLAFGENNSMSDYFDEVSRGQLNVEGTIYGPYTLEGDAADYGTENPDFVRDSVEIADDDIDFRDYDAVVVVHSGPGEESSGNSDDIWSVHWPSISISTNDNGYVIRKISQVPEYQTVSGQNNPLGVWCHEFGHEIGLPDLYDTDGSSGGIGDWGVMASGGWGNNGETPTYLSAWSRYWLGWVEPIIITEDINNLELKPVETDGDVYLLPIPGNWSNSEQYYLLENRQQMKYDAYLPGEGLLIWHIDEEIIDSNWNSNSVNDDETHKGVDLEEADGDDDLDSKTNYGDSGDPYTSGSFRNDSYPNSLAYNGTESGWKIDNIRLDGDNVIIDISFLSKPNAVAEVNENPIAEGLEVQFYGDESSDEDGNIVSYTWDFGDGEFAYVDNPTHTFNQNGSYEVKLTVCDNHNLCDSMTLTIFVNKPPIPVVEISNYTIMLGDKITFDASDSYDIDGDVEFYYWNFDDGYESNQAFYEHEYKNSGTYNVLLQISDDLQDITTTYYTIIVINRLPIVNFEISPESGNTLDTFQFSDISYDDDGEIESWVWNFSDGEEAYGQNVEHQFSLPGTYDVTLTVTDDQGGINSAVISIEVSNAPPIPEIRIPDGIKLNNYDWKVPADRDISIDGSVTFDNENDVLEFFWNVNGQELFGESITTSFNADTTIELRVTDSRGGEGIKTFQISQVDVPNLIINNSENLTNVALPNLPILQASSSENLDLYMWYVEKMENDGSMIVLDEIIANSSLSISNSWGWGEYFIKVSGRHIDTNLWTQNFSMIMFIYEKPNAKFYFNETINEGQWLTFDSTESTGFWNGSKSLEQRSLDLTYKWILDGNELAGSDEIITTLVETGGRHTIQLMVFQDPVGQDSHSVEFYADYKPWGIMSTFPEKPTYGEDFELYLNAYDEESEAVIDTLEITAFDYEGIERATLLYENQGANFNVIFEVEYTGTMVLEYLLTDEMGNSNTSIRTIEVLGWADIYVESIKVKGTKEHGKKQTVEFVLTNFNETYQTSIYNGRVAVGSVDLLIGDEIMNTWTYSIDPTESKLFSFDWIAIAGSRDFHVIAYVTEGEEIADNNNLSISVTFSSERKTGFIPYPSISTVILGIIATSYLLRRKAN